MSAEQAQREPTMEEILASIRRIISEEDKPAEAGADVLDLQPPPQPAADLKPAPPVAAAPPAVKPLPAAAPPPPKPEPVSAKSPAPVFPASDFEAAARALDDELMIVEHEAEPPEPPPPVLEQKPEPVLAKPAPPPEPKPDWRLPPSDVRTLVSEPIASRTAGELGRLMGTMLVSTGNTLDDVVRELLKPMLKEWLEANLPQIVEAEVAKEIDRIRRMSR